MFGEYKSTVLPYLTPPTWTVSPPPAMPAGVHEPVARRSCKDADRVADEQIDGLVALLRQPCPHCGKKRDEEEETTP